MEQKLKKEKIKKIITAILVGLLLLIVVVPIGDKGEKANVKSSYYEEENVQDFGATYYEERLKSILEKSYGPGTMEVMVHMREEEETTGMYEESSLMVDGILIVADVQSETDIGNITFAVCALFDLPAHKVAVIRK